MIHILVVVAVLLSGCWGDWPPLPDAGMDWTPPERTSVVEGVPPYVRPTQPDAGVEDVDADAGGADFDGGL